MNLSKRYAQWLKICRQWREDTEVATRIFDDLVRRYSTEKRHYHSLSHIEMMLSLAEQNQTAIKQWEATFFAVWFHDAIQGMLINGEQESAELCQQSLAQLNVPNYISNTAFKMICATKHHTATCEADLGIFLDLDLAILGSPWPDYQKYANKTRLEYAIPSWLFKRGRVDFLRKKLATTTIFNSQVFQQKYEKRARENILLELALLLD